MQELLFDVHDAPSAVEIVDAQQLEGVQKLCEELSLVRSESGVFEHSTGAIFVPDVRYLRLRLLVVAHQGIAGHRGMDVTLGWLRSHVYWPGLEEDVRRFCKSCLQCMCCTGGAVVPRPYAHTMVATEPNQVLHLDFLYVRDAGGEPGVPEYLLVMKDGFSKYVDLWPCLSADAVVVVEALVSWFAKFGVVHTIVSDKGSHFWNGVVKELCSRLGVAQHVTVAYAPWANGQAENLCGQVRKLLSLVLMDAKLSANQWLSAVPTVVFAINNTPTRLLAGYSPLEVFTGHKPYQPLDVVFNPKDKQFGSVVLSVGEVRECVERFVECFEKVQREVAAVPVREAQHRGAVDVDFGVGDFVLVAARMGSTIKDKTRALWTGPERVIEEVGTSGLVYKVEHLVTGHVREVHAQFLKRYADKELVVTEQLREFVAHQGTGFVVENLKEHRWNEGAWQIRVHWRGFDDPADDTWEPLENLVKDVEVMVKRYLKLVPPSPEKEELVNFVSECTRQVGVAHKRRKK